MRRRHVVGVHRISSNNALARVALRDDDARDDDSNNDDVQQTRTVAADRQQQRGRAD